MKATSLANTIELNNYLIKHSFLSSTKTATPSCGSTVDLYFRGLTWMLCSFERGFYYHLFGVFIQLLFVILCILSLPFRPFARTHYFWQSLFFPSCGNPFLHVYFASQMSPQNFSEIIFFLNYWWVSLVIYMRWAACNNKFTHVSLSWYFLF